MRGLEAEVRELKDLLDEKDEKIDMLSRLQSFSPPSRKCSTTLSLATIEQVKQEIESAKEDVLLVEVPCVTSTADVAGASSTAAFIEAFDQKAHDDGHDDADIRAGKFAQLSRPLTPSAPLPRTSSKVPPRLLSDQYISECRLACSLLRADIPSQISSSKNGNHFYQFSIAQAFSESTRTIFPTQKRVNGTATNKQSRSCFSYSISQHCHLRRSSRHQRPMKHNGERRCNQRHPPLHWPLSSAMSLHSSSIS